MRIIALIIPLIWGTVIFGHGKEKHEPKIKDDQKVDNTSQMVIPDTVSYTHLTLPTRIRV